jgi:hypothetical protein
VARTVRGKVRRVLRRRDVTRAFAVRPNGRFEGLVTGLPLGRSVLRATAGRRRGPAAVVVNHPNGGPVFSGPQVQPWVCQKTAVDEQCNQPPAYSFLYRSTSPARSELAPYDPKDPPSDVASTTTDEGVRVPFIVRIETGYQDRDEYKIATLYQPGKPWEPWAPQEQWNRKLLITHGSSCGVEYAAGEAPSVIRDSNGIHAIVDQVPDVDSGASPTVALARGFAVMSTALDHNGHNCNIVVQAESLVMAKEHLVEKYGPLRYTIGTGCSGGSLTQQQVANAYPGVYQGLLPQCSYPDTLSPGAQFADYHVLRTYFENPERWGQGVSWEPSQWSAVEGHLTHGNAIAADEGLFKEAINPMHPCKGVSDAQRYHPQTNPGGVRCDALTYMINVLGPRRASVWTETERKLRLGFAGVPFSNVGIQYGLGALERGDISPAQFVDLNARVGGLDLDLNPVAERIPGDDGSIRNAYRSGALNQANNLDRVAIINLSGPDPGLAHDFSHATWTRERILRAHGHARNYVMWFGHEPIRGSVTYTTEGLLAMDRWLAAVEKNTARRPLAERVVASRPGDLQDRCSQLPDFELLELPSIGKVCELPLVQTQLGTPRTIAGGPAANDTNKCRLRPLRRADYTVEFTDEQWAQLQAAFPAGVCDWSKPGVEQRDTVAWQTYQERDGRVIYGGRPLGPRPARSGAGWASEAFRR